MLQLDGLEAPKKREIVQKPATPLGRTIQSIQVAFHSSRGDHSPFNEQPIVAKSRPATGFSVEFGIYLRLLSLLRHAQKTTRAFDPRRVLIQLIAQAGGAEVLDNVPNNSEFLDESRSFPGIVEMAQDAPAFVDAIEARDKCAAAANSKSTEDERDTGEEPSR